MFIWIFRVLKCMYFIYRIHRSILLSTINSTNTLNKRYEVENMRLNSNQQHTLHSAYTKCAHLWFFLSLTFFFVRSLACSFVSISAHYYYYFKLNFLLCRLFHIFTFIYFILFFFFWYYFVLLLMHACVPKGLSRDNRNLKKNHNTESKGERERKSAKESEMKRDRRDGINTSQ